MCMCERVCVCASSLTPDSSAVVVGVGFVLAFVMIGITKILKNTMGEDNRKTEMFMTANRTINTGLTSSAVISSWLWSTAMLGSSLVGYSYGVSGPFWFAAGYAKASLPSCFFLSPRGRIF